MTPFSHCLLLLARVPACIECRLARFLATARPPQRAPECARRAACGAGRHGLRIAWPAGRRRASRPAPARYGALTNTSAACAPALLADSPRGACHRPPRVAASVRPFLSLLEPQASLRKHTLDCKPRNSCAARDQACWRGRKRWRSETCPAAAAGRDVAGSCWYPCPCPDCPPALFMRMTQQRAPSNPTRNPRHQITTFSRRGGLGKLGTAE